MFVSHESIKIYINVTGRPRQLHKNTLRRYSQWPPHCQLQEPFAPELKCFKVQCLGNILSKCQEKEKIFLIKYKSSLKKNAPLSQAAKIFSRNYFYSVNKICWAEGQGLREPFLERICLKMFQCKLLYCILVAIKNK